MMREEFSGKTPNPRLSPEERERRNRGVLFSFTVVCGLALFLVAGLPGALIAPALAQIFALAGLGAGFVATLWREPLFAVHFTHWDKAAALTGLSIVAGMLTEPALVEQAMAQLGASGGPGDPTGDGRAQEHLATPYTAAGPAGL